MALTSQGRVFSCPCCGLGISFAFQEVQLLTLQPASVFINTYADSMPITRVTRKMRVCRQCGFIIDLPMEDDNNRWAALNAARIKANTSLLAPSQPVTSPIPEKDTNVVAATPVELNSSTEEEETIDSLTITDELDPEIPVSAVTRRVPAGKLRQ